MASGHFTPHRHSMATCFTLLNILAAQFIISNGLSSRYHSYNNKYFTPTYHLHGYEAGHKYKNHLKNLQLNNNFYFPNVPRTRQNKNHHQVIPIPVGRGGKFSPNEENAERKITFYENLKPNQINSSKSPSKKKLSFENFVTPKLEPLPKKNYDVTTKATREIISTVRPPGLPDNDVPIALDDEDVEDEDSVTTGVYAVKGRRRPEHLNPLVYVDSYGKAHKRPGSDDLAEASVRDYGLEKPSGRVVVHQSPGYSHGRDYGYSGHDSQYGVLAHPTHHYRKQTGRVRMQVFRGPTRKYGKYGRKRYAPWGYYVVQPADNSHHYKHHYP